MKHRVQLAPLGDVSEDREWDPAGSWGLDSSRARAFITASDDGTYDGDRGSRLPTARECWEQSVWLHTCIHKVASYGARQKVSLKRDAGSEILKHPALSLMYRPNPIMSRFELFYVTMAWMYLMGDAFWFLDNGTVTNGRATGLMTPQFIWAVSPVDVTPIPDLTARVPKLLGWRIMLANGYAFEAAPSEIVQFKFPNPFPHTTPWRGAAPLMTARMATANDIESARHNLKFFRNGARPMGVLEAEEDLKKVQRDQMLDAFEARHRNNPHRPALLTMGTKYHETQISNAEMELMEGRKFNRNEIAAAFNVPPVELGDMDQASYANANAQLSIMWRGTIIPGLDLVADAINQFLLKDDYFTGNIVTYFDLKNVEALKTDRKEEADLVNIYARLGVPMAMLNKKFELGLDHYEGDDVGLVDGLLVPLDTLINPPDPAPTTAPVPNADAPAATKAIDFATEVRNLIRHTRAPILRLTDGSNPLALARRERANSSAAVQTGQMTSLVSRIISMAGAFVRAGAALKGSAFDELLKDMLLVIEADKKTLKDFSEPFFRQATGVGIKDMNSLVSGSFSIDSPDVLAFIQSKTIRVTRIEDYQAELIRDAVAITFEEGGSYQDLYTDLQDVFNFTASRARMIARNEIADAASGGRFLTLKGEGVERHEWVAEIDERTRDTHAECDGAEAVVGEVFEITECRYPHDPDGPAEETIQCRCITLPIDDSGERKFALGSEERAANWTAFVRTWSPIKTAYQRRLKRMFKEERDIILAMVEEKKAA
jgi:HK97 family phage portal protein